MVQSSAEESRPRRRIVPIVDSRFQWKYTLLIMALGVGLTAIAGALLYRAHMASTRLLDLAQNPQLQAEVMRDDQIFLLYLIVLVILMGVGLGFWGLIVTHRISGPLHIVARYLGVLGSGRYPDMRPLRKRDELQEFFAIFEEAVNAMRTRDLMMMRDIEVAMAEVEQGLRGDNKRGLEYAHQALKRYRSALADSLGAGEGVAVD
ncbi:MAG: hypothetical protein A2289_26860 [Deltaproteobacteria bacterium RIFOXYA12_FULL_58_15]|nr:MAG: hypothetical protein A2289_26860 [Deltaproteobacteria bacterium RIFOXYA12_FULL_58_15]OGR09321.1 MAG: hypothetical protein A2341_02105 [Deltaproteobacteria bacterium RIFOXYB12_FULL_58_9]